MSDWCVYTLQSQVTGRLYTGITNNLERRLRAHNETSKGAKATRAGRPWVIVLVEPDLTRSQALKRELQIKKLTRAQKLVLIHERGKPSLLGTQQ